MAHLTARFDGTAAPALPLADGVAEAEPAAPPAHDAAAAVAHDSTAAAAAADEHAAAAATAAAAAEAAQAEAPLDVVGDGDAGGVDPAHAPIPGLEPMDGDAVEHEAPVVRQFLSRPHTPACFRICRCVGPHTFWLDARWRGGLSTSRGSS